MGRGKWAALWSQQGLIQPPGETRTLGRPSEASSSGREAKASFLRLRQADIGAGSSRKGTVTPGEAGAGVLFCPSN